MYALTPFLWSGIVERDKWRPGTGSLFFFGGEGGARRRETLVDIIVLFRKYEPTSERVNFSKKRHLRYEVFSDSRDVYLPTNPPTVVGFGSLEIFLCFRMGEKRKRAREFEK